MENVLIKYRDLIISKDQLDYFLDPKLKGFALDNPINITNQHVINMLEKFSKGLINDQELLDWVNVIWFSGWYEYQDEYAVCIASILNELEEIDEDGKELNTIKIEKFIEALKENREYR